MGEIVTVTVADFLVQQTEDYGIVNKTYRQVYNFFSRYDQKFFYNVKTEDGRLPAVVEPSAIREFEHFGITFGECVVRIKKKQFLLILKGSDLENLESLQAAVEREKAGTECPAFGYAVIEKDYGTGDAGILQRECDNSLLREVLPHVIVFNRGFPEIVPVVQSEKRLAAKYAYRNFAGFFAGRSVNSGSLPLNLKNLDAIYNDILSVKGERVIYNCDSIPEKGINLSDPVYRTLLPSMAAYLALEHKFRFEFAGILNDLYLLAASDLVRRFHNYVDEYFKLISNPVDCGFDVKDRLGYLYILDRNEMYENPGKFCPIARFASTRFDLDTLSIAGDGVVITECRLDNIKILGIENLFGVDSPSVAEAKKGMIALGKVLGKFAAVLRAEHYPVREILDVTNTVLYQSGSTVWLAYVIKITGVYPYNVQPVNTRFKSFKEYIDVNMLSNIKDLLLLEDGVVYEKLMLKHNWVEGGNNHYKLPHTAHGVVYSRLVAVEGQVTEDTARADELGLWYHTSTQFRGTVDAGVLPLLSLSAARDCNFITCFSGPHPCICTNFNFDYRYWR